MKAISLEKQGIGTCRQNLDRFEVQKGLRMFTDKDCERVLEALTANSGHVVKSLRELRCPSRQALEKAMTRARRMASVMPRPRHFTHFDSDFPGRRRRYTPNVSAKAEVATPRCSPHRIRVTSPHSGEQMFLHNRPSSSGINWQTPRCVHMSI